MRREELQFDLPDELIAQRPAQPRDSSRLLVVNRTRRTLAHHTFRDLPDLLQSGDRLVLNDTRVVPARFFCHRSTGGKIEGLFLRQDHTATWRVLLRPSARLHIGEELQLSGTDSALRLTASHPRGEWQAELTPPEDALIVLDRIGRTPLPPYINRDRQPDTADLTRYQTVYAASPGAVAAPTAGLHFTPALLDRLPSRGIERTTVTLHVGLGTFAPVVVDELSTHEMHAEWYAVSPLARSQLRNTREAGGRLVAVGTTATRVLETINLADESPDLQSGWTDLFIYPPYTFQNTDALITNFHLPGSTLIALVMALAGQELIRHAYQTAIAERYRFYSYGDAMLIL